MSIEDTVTRVGVTRTEAREPHGPSPTAELVRGTSIGRYVVIGQLGRGAMGTVYRAYDPSLDRAVALKLLARRLDTSAESRLRLVSEARAMAQLKHRNAAAVYDVGEHENQVYIAMEVVEGQTLREWLASDSRPTADILRIFRQAGEGLGAAHRAGIVHRDFKPDNVMLEGDRVVVMDFGLARAHGQRHASEDGDDSARIQALAPSGFRTDDITRTGTLVGTPAYMSPEQVLHNPITPASDQFSFCVALYEAVAGARPFSASSLAEMTRGIATRSHAPLAADSGLNARQRAAIDRGLSKLPEQRFPGMADLLEALRPQPSRKRAWMLAAAAILSGVTITYGLAAADDATAACKRGRASIDEVWNAARGDALATEFSGIGLAYVGPAWARASDTLDTYAADWSTTFYDACTATRVRGEHSDAKFDAQAACLTQARARLGSLLDEFETPDDALARNLADAVAGLPDPEACLEREASAGHTVTAFETDAMPELAASEAGNDVGRHDRALRQSEALLESIGDRPLAGLRARVGAARARALAKLGRADDAIAGYRRALLLAVAPEDAQLAARTWVDLAEMLAVAAQRPLEAEALLLPAEVAVVAAGGDIDDRIRFETVRAGVDYMLGRGEDAVRRAREVLAKIESSPAEPTLAEKASEILGAALARTGAFEEAVAMQRRNIAAIRARYGDQHPQVAGTLPSLARACRAAGDNACARGAAAEGLQILAPLGPDAALDRATLLYELALATTRDDAPAARAATEEALELYEELAPRGDIRRVAAASLLSALARGRGDEVDELRWLGRAEDEARTGSATGGALANLIDRRGNLLRRNSQLEPALALYRESIAQYEASGDASERCVPMTHVVEVLLELGRARDALASSGAAVEVCSRHHERSQAAYAHYARAQALWRASPGRSRTMARAEATTALELLGKNDEEFAAELEAWLANPQ